MTDVLSMCLNTLSSCYITTMEYNKIEIMKIAISSYEQFTNKSTFDNPENIEKLRKVNELFTLIKLAVRRQDVAKLDDSLNGVNMDNIDQVLESMYVKAIEVNYFGSDFNIGKWSDYPPDEDVDNSADEKKEVSYSKVVLKAPQKTFVTSSGKKKVSASSSRRKGVSTNQKDPESIDGEHEDLYYLQCHRKGRCVPICTCRKDRKKHHEPTIHPIIITFRKSDDHNYLYFMPFLYKNGNCSVDLYLHYEEKPYAYNLVGTYFYLRSDGYVMYYDEKKDKLQFVVNGSGYTVKYAINNELQELIESASEEQVNDEE
jgi:hypothetical protein